MNVNVCAEELEKENMGRGEQSSFLRLSFTFSKKPGKAFLQFF